MSVSTVKLKSNWTKHTAHRVAGKRTLRLGALRSLQWPQNSKGLKATELKRVKNKNKVKQKSTTSWNSVFHKFLVTSPKSVSSNRAHSTGDPLYFSTLLLHCLNPYPQPCNPSPPPPPLMLAISRGMSLTCNWEGLRQSPGCSFLIPHFPRYNFSNALQLFLRQDNGAKTNTVETTQVTLGNLDRDRGVLSAVTEKGIQL